MKHVFKILVKKWNNQSYPKLPDIVQMDHTFLPRTADTALYEAKSKEEKIS